jgi:hypothetical protein
MHKTIIFVSLLPLLVCFFCSKIWSPCVLQPFIFSPLSSSSWSFSPPLSKLSISLSTYASPFLRTNVHIFTYLCAISLPLSSISTKDASLWSMKLIGRCVEVRRTPWDSSCCKSQWIPLGGMTSNITWDQWVTQLKLGASLKVEDHLWIPPSDDLDTTYESTKV